MRKDHKGDLDNDPQKGPKLWPLCTANKAPNAALGNLVAKILKAVGDKMIETIGAEVISTEQLKREFQKVNLNFNKKWENDKEIAKNLEEGAEQAIPLQSRNVMK